MKGRYIFIFVFLFAVTVRAILNFSTPLVPGIGGGYNLVQKEGENLIYPGKTSIFIQQEVPDNAELVYDSQYFEMYAFRPGG